MIDEQFHTDRDVGEFIEGLRSSSRARKRGVRARSRTAGGRPSRNETLLDMIDDMEAQLKTLSNRSGYSAQEAFEDRHPRRAGERRAMRQRNQASAPSRAPLRQPTPEIERDNYRSALERIESQLKRVDQAIGRNDDHARMRDMTRQRPVRQPRAAHISSNRSASDGLDTALRQLMDQTQQLSNDFAEQKKFMSDRAQQASVRDESLDVLRDDIASLRDLLEEANFSGASDRMLQEIAALSSRIETLSIRIGDDRRDPEMMDAIRDIQALLDRPAVDPAIDDHFERVLSKLDNVVTRDHYEDFAKLSAQMDNLRDIMAAAPQAQHLSHISGQMGMMVERLGALEEDLRRSHSEPKDHGLSQELEQRLGLLQNRLESLDPNDRLMRLEDQLAALADRLEQGTDRGDVTRPLETLAHQVESLVGLVDRREDDPQMRVLQTLADRIDEMDRRMQDVRHPEDNGQRFDQVERTLARIDDMLARQMESSDLSVLEANLSRLADRIETQEEVLRSFPLSMAGDQGTAEQGSVNLASMVQLEKQIADLADRLDGASRGGDTDPQFFETLTSRLDDLAEQFAQSQSRFDAVDRLGADIQQLAASKPSGVADESKMAEQAALKALQKIGPIGAGSPDGPLDVIIDGLKDDLHGLRKFAENSESSTHQSLGQVTSMLNTIVDRLGALEGEVRAGEQVRAPSVRMTAPVPDRAETENQAQEAAPKQGGLGRLLKRGKKADTSEAPTQEQPEAAKPVQAMTAAELLASRGKKPSRNAPEKPARPTQGRQPGISLRGKAVSQQADAIHDGDEIDATQAQIVGNTALKVDPKPAIQRKKRTAQVVEGAAGPAPAAASEAGVSKADFIAAARRAAQAAAQESAQVEKDQSEARSFLSRFKGSKKADEQQAAPEQPEQQDQEKLRFDGLNRKERRAAIAEAARKAKQVKDLDAPAPAQSDQDENDATLVSDYLDEENAPNSILSKLTGTVSRHSRPLLMAAAAILLAITTLQLAKNPNSSLHGLFNGDSAPVQESIEAPMPSEVNPADPSDQSSLTPSSGSLVPQMDGEEASRAITFAEPSGVESSLHGPRVSKNPVMSSPTQMAAVDPSRLPSSQGDVPGIGQGIDLTPTSSIPKQIDPALQAEAMNQTLPPAPSVSSDSANNASAEAISPSVQAAIDMNKMLAPGISDSPLLKAAKAGDALAQFEMGRRLTLGQGMTADLSEAAKWFEKAADQSMPQAQYSLANLYEKGKGVKRDMQVARLWYQRAAEAGNVKAMHNLAVLYAEGGLGKPDFTQASRWFVRAADHGLMDSQYNLAILYARGMGVKQDLLQSYKWFAIAAKNGDKGAVSKRDEVLKVLNKAQRKGATALLDNWVPKVAKPSANNLANIPDEWKVKAPAQITASNQTQPMASDPNVIAQAQSMLGALGYNAGPADGQMGPRTRTAIRNFQEVAGLPVTGKIDKALLEALSLRAI